MLLFRSEAHVDRWLAGREPGATIPDHAAGRACGRLVAGSAVARLATAHQRAEPGDPRSSRPDGAVLEPGLTDATDPGAQPDHRSVDPKVKNLSTDPGECGPDLSFDRRWGCPRTGGGEAAEIVPHETFDGNAQTLAGRLHRERPTVGHPQSKVHRYGDLGTGSRRHASLSICSDWSRMSTRAGKSMIGTRYATPGPRTPSGFGRPALKMSARS
jgi:hypothetical protein